ncbi:Aga2p [Lachancea thermotolerans CBS 6340]|uniref:KLTH0H09306p n=1 Tax=Lachancea thermotolerans (strain ATCC 56472 / CBS 6340 / NRRL Y-8284) TaxID=559295 RepID=C5E306_LACTC|nr:KLTH0H09306p [Lachancea thermotolerans CBS 6340]CAR30417.1 KLTH0H09306p [Lachancea thermotolerans CBS 6340]
MKFSSVVTAYLAIFPSMCAAATVSWASVSCESISTGGTLETTPYSSSTATILKNGKEMVGVYEFFQSVTYISDCNPSTRKTSAEPNPTITIY